MPIERRSPRECAERFREHIASLISRTLGDLPAQLKLFVVGDRFRVAFRRGDDPVTVPLKTRFGTLFFYIAQLVEAQKDGKLYRLRTLRYWYRLQASEGLEADALLRWEYERLDPRQPKPPRHHFQAPAKIPCPVSALDLNRLHTPSGWITIEELIRFLIVELEVKPATRGWPSLLAASEDVFFNKFSGKRKP